MSKLFPPGYQFLDANGDPVGSGTVTFYKTGTVTLLTVYTDATFATPATNAQPLSAEGRLNQGDLYGTGPYTVVLKDSAGAQVWSRDDHSPLDEVAGVTNYQYGSEADVATHSGIITGHLIKTSYHNSARTSGSGGEFAFTNVTDATKTGAAHWPDADGSFYDNDGKEFFPVGDRASVLLWGAVRDGTTQTAIIQKAIDGMRHAETMNAGLYPQGGRDGGTIDIPQGVVLAPAAITWRPNVTVIEETGTNLNYYLNGENTSGAVSELNLISGFHPGLIIRTEPTYTIDTIVTEAWVGSTAYALAKRIVNSGPYGDHAYECTTAGTSAASGGPIAGPTSTGTHDGANNAAVLTDTTEAWTVNSLIGLTLTNSTNAGTTIVTANTATTITGVLSGGEDWDIGDTWVLAGTGIPDGTCVWKHVTAKQVQGRRASVIWAVGDNDQWQIANNLDNTNNAQDDHLTFYSLNSTRQVLHLSDTGNIRYGRLTAKQDLTNPTSAHVFNGNEVHQQETGTNLSTTLQIVSTGVPDNTAITNATRDNPCVITTQNTHGLANGALINITGMPVGGMVNLNGNDYTVANVVAKAKTFELSGIDSSLFAAYTTGGQIGPQITQSKSIGLSSGDGTYSMLAKDGSTFVLKVTDTGFVRAHSGISPGAGFTTFLLTDIGSALNTVDKEQFKIVGNSNTGRMIYASGPGASAAWKHMDDSTAHSPFEPTGTHTGANNAAVLTDSTEAWTVNSLIGLTLTNSTDGSSTTVTANTATTMTGVLAGGTDDDWDIGDTWVLS